MGHHRTRFAAVCRCDSGCCSTGTSRPPEDEHDRPRGANRLEPNWLEHGRTSASYPPGKASQGLEGRASLQPGSTGSPPTGASTRFARPADAQPRSGTCPMSNLPSRPDSGEVVWLELYPDALLDAAIDVPLDPGGPPRTDRSHLPGLRDRPAAPARSPARRAHPARRARIPRQRGGRHARLHRRIDQQRPQTGPRHPPAPPAAYRRTRTGSLPPTHSSSNARRQAHSRRPLQRRRHAGGPAHRGRPRLDATDALRI